MRRLLVLSAVVLAAGSAAMMEAQPARDIAMRISMPGARPILRVRNGEIGTITLGNARTFGIRPTVVAATSGLVNVSVLEGARRGEMLGHVETLRGEIRAGDEETRRYMRVLHEDLVGRITLLGEARRVRKKRR